jgi:predicted ATPase
MIIMVTVVSRLVIMTDEDPGPSPGIRTHDQRLRVFVSSTLGELNAERDAARAAIEQLRLHPVMFESGARPHPAQAVYHAFLDQSDVFVGIYWQSYGWVGPDADTSGLEDEFRLAERMPRLLYVKRPAPDIEDGLSQMLREIKNGGRLTYKTFADAGELRELVVNDLATLLTERFGDAGRASPQFSVPAPATGLVGRDRDVAEVASLLSSGDHRLVVLTGAGGVGKTRLALAVLEETRPHWEDGAAFADLSAVADPSTVPDAIASALGFAREGREVPLDTLERRLADKHMLVVIDNFEQVLPAGPALAELLRRVPRLHLLVTSRVVLRVRGEREWRVEPLGLLAEGDDPARIPAVQLFVDRIADARPGFELTRDDAEAIAELCRRLDGLPLALELAASWTRLLTPRQLLQRLHEHLQRPGALADLPGRQQTMAATVEWSYQLLPEDAQQMLARLSVFAAPFTVDAVGAVCGQDAASTTEGLALLVDHNMVSPAQRPDGEPAFRMLNVIQRFAFEHLEEPEETRARLESYLLAILERAGARRGSEDWARRLLDSESPNLWAVLRWAAERERPSGELLRRTGDVWVWLLTRRHFGRASELSRRIQSWPAAGLPGECDTLAHDWLTMIALQDDGQYTQAGSLIDRILPDARRLEQPARWGQMMLVRALARPYAEHSAARAEYEEALAAARDLGDTLELGYVLSHFGMLLSADGDPSRAQGMHEEMLAIARSLGDDNLHAEAHYALALDALAAGDPGSARPHLAASARLYTDIDHREGLARCLGALAALAMQHERSDLAARLVGATAAVRAIGVTPWPVVVEGEDRVIKQIQVALPEAEFSSDVAAGRALTVEAALAEAWAALEDGANAEVEPGT